MQISVCLFFVTKLVGSKGEDIFTGGNDNEAGKL